MCLAPFGFALGLAVGLKFGRELRDRARGDPVQPVGGLDGAARVVGELLEVVELRSRHR
jgi:hypothetical protein